MIKRTKVRNVNKRKKNRRVTKKGGVLPIRIYPQADLLNAIYENNLEKVQAWGRTTTTTRDVNFNMNDQDNIYQNGYTPLTYAISRTTENSENFVDIVNLDIIKHLVSVKKANVNTRGGSVHNGTLNYTPLMFSIIRGKKDAMIYLLQMGALVDDTIDNNTTVFNFAFIKGGLEIVNTLLENTKILNMKSINDKGQLDALLKNTAHLNIIINFKEVYGKTTLMYVLENGKLENGKLEIVNKLLEKGARVDIFDNVNNTPLMYACENGNLEIVNTLLKKNSTLINHSNKFGKTALMYACEKGNLEIVNVLLQNNSYINHSNKFGNTALMYACEKGNLEIVNVLLQNNSYINLSNKFGKTALMYACEKGNLEIVNKLLENKSYINLSNDYGQTALIYACENGNLEIVNKLLEKRADVNAYKTNLLNIKNNYPKTMFCKTALMCACENGNLEIVNALLEKLVDVNAYSMNFFMCACENGNLEIVNALLNTGAHVNPYGKTALMYACEKEKLDIVNKLLEKGANPKACGKTALNYATDDIKKLLNKYAKNNTLAQSVSTYKDLIYPPLMIAVERENTQIQNALKTKINDPDYVKRVNEFLKKNTTYKSSGYGTSSIDVGSLVGSFF